jgi:hypothetical protein
MITIALKYQYLKQKHVEIEAGIKRTDPAIPPSYWVCHMAIIHPILKSHYVDFSAFIFLKSAERANRKRWSITFFKKVIIASKRTDHTLQNSISC